MNPKVKGLITFLMSKYLCHKYKHWSIEYLQKYFLFMIVRRYGTQKSVNLRGRSLPCGSLAFSISKATMLMMITQMGLEKNKVLCSILLFSKKKNTFYILIYILPNLSRSSGSFFTKLMAVTHWDSNLKM